MIFPQMLAVKEPVTANNNTSTVVNDTRQGLQLKQLVL